jgi:putative intracellular protease/amidase
MEDLAHSEVLGRVVGTMYGRGRLIIAVCHGPAGLLTTADRSAPAWWAGNFAPLERPAAEHRRFP